MLAQVHGRRRVDQRFEFGFRIYDDYGKAIAKPPMYVGWMLNSFSPTGVEYHPYLVPTYSVDSFKNQCSDILREDLETAAEASIFIPIGIRTVRLPRGERYVCLDMPNGTICHCLLSDVSDMILNFNRVIIQLAQA